MTIPARTLLSALHEVVSTWQQEADALGGHRLSSEDRTYADTLLKCANEIAGLEYPHPEGDEIGWLIEHVSMPPRWFDGSVLFTEDASKALRFSRRADAEQAIQRVIPFDLRLDVKAVEHMWVSR